MTFYARAAATGVGWPVPPGVSDVELETRLFKSLNQCRLEPIDFACVEREMRSHKHMVIALVWEEYANTVDVPASYSYFCDFYCAWRKAFPRLTLSHLPRKTIWQ